MSALRSTLILSLCMLFVSGCFEDEAVITLNTDGSGTLTQTLKLSEKLLVAVSEGDKNENTPPATKEALRDEIGSALTITTLHETDLPDGGKVMKIKGTFDSPEQFFLSKYCQDNLDLRVAPAGEGKAAIHSKAAFGGDTDQGPTVTQLYGLAKGMCVSRTLHLPAEIEHTNGQLSDDKKSVSWVMDLRSQEGLAKTKAFLEGPDKGKGIAVFDAAALTFSLPLKAENEVMDTVEESSPQTKETPDTGKFRANVAWVSCNKKSTAEGTMETSDLEIGVELRWEEDTSPVRCKPPVLLSVLDDQNKDLVADTKPKFMQSQISSVDQKNQKKVLTQRLAIPSEHAQKLKDISGSVDVVAGVKTEEVVLEDVQTLVGDESVGNALLDRLHFKILKIDGSSIKIEIDGGNDTIAAFEPVKEDGSVSDFQSRSGWENTHYYTFADDFSRIQKCRLEVVVSEDLVKVPFSLGQIRLP